MSRTRWPRWAKVLTIVGGLSTALGGIERLAGWLSGATQGDIQVAAKNIQDWAASAPLLKLPGVPTTLVIVGVILLATNIGLFFIRPTLTPQSKEQPNPGREKRRMDCQRCQGTGRAVAETIFGIPTLRFRCSVCEGHGNYISDLWSQPDCAHCRGSGRAIDARRAFVDYWRQCDVCKGHGKRPYGV